MKSRTLVGVTERQHWQYEYQSQVEEYLVDVCIFVKCIESPRTLRSPAR